LTVFFTLVSFPVMPPELCALMKRQKWIKICEVGLERYRV
jgi:hypothetical protein